MTHVGIVLELGAVTIDVNDLDRMARFWGEMLGQEPGPPRSGGGWVTFGTVEGNAWLVLQQVPEPKTVKDRIHLDFVVANVADGIDRIVALGGRQVSEPRVTSGVTMEDPEGNEFCIGAFRSTKEYKRIPV